MEKWRFERVKQVLKDYPTYDKKIAEIELEIRHPHKPTDYASDRQGTKITPETTTEKLYAIECNKHRRAYKRAQRAVDELLDECDKDTGVIIQELYITRFPRYTMEGLIQQRKIDCGKSKAFSLRNRFFSELDQLL